MNRIALSTLLLIACCVSGCGKPTPKPEQFYGTWRDTSEATLDATMTFNKDGTLSADVKVKREAGPEEITLGGTWKFAEGKLTITIDHASADSDKYAGTDTDAVTAMDDRSFTVVDAAGKSRVFTRVN